MRAGVPVLSLPTGKPSFLRLVPGRCRGSPRRPEDALELPMKMALHEGTVARLIAFPTIRCPPLGDDASTVSVRGYEEVPDGV
jgi:hypothetical protein